MFRCEGRNFISNQFEYDYNDKVLIMACMNHTKWFRGGDSWWENRAEFKYSWTIKTSGIDYISDEFRHIFHTQADKYVYFHCCNQVSVQADWLFDLMPCRMLTYTALTAIILFSSFASLEFLKTIYSHLFVEHANHFIVYNQMNQNIVAQKKNQKQKNVEDRREFWFSVCLHYHQLVWSNLASNI